MKPLTITLSVEDTASLQRSGGTLWYRAKRVHVVLLLASALAEIQTTIKRRAGLAAKKEAKPNRRIFWIQRDGVSFAGSAA